MTLSAYLPWQTVTHGHRKPIVTCWRCHASIVNDTKAMHRRGWQESGSGWGHPVYHCGECAKRGQP